MEKQLKRHTKSNPAKSSSAAARSAAEPRHGEQTPDPAAPFVEAFTDYVQTLERIHQDTRGQVGKAYQQFQEAVRAAPDDVARANANSELAQTIREVGQVGHQRDHEDAFRAYVQALASAWAAVGVEDFNSGAIAAIGQSMITAMWAAEVA